MRHAATLLALIAFAAPVPAFAQDCRIPILRHGIDGFSVSYEEVADGSSRVLIPGSAARVITPIVPVSEGMSGDVVRASEEGLLMLRCEEDMIRVLAVPEGGGAAEEVMSGPRDARSRWVVRVNAIASGGERAAFQLREHGAELDDGPVIDLFQGRVPLEEGDVVVTIETREKETARGPTLRGSVPVRARGLYAAVPVRLSDGTEGTFILDLAASRSLIFRDLLPPDAPVRRMVAVERSEKGTRELGGAAQAAGGTASDIGSVAELSHVMIGDVRVDEFEPLVLDQPFIVDGTPIDGIIGLDVLRRAGRVRADFGRPSKEGTLLLGGDPLEESLALPVREVRSLLFFDGMLGDRSLLLLLDSGARLSVVPEDVAGEAGWKLAATAADSLRGADGAPLPVRSVEVPPLRIGDWIAPGSPFTAGSIPVLEALGLGEDAGILGQPFWRAVGTVEVDFEQHVVRVPRR
jgi:hypothetical protein